MRVCGAWGWDIIGDAAVQKKILRNIQAFCRALYDMWRMRSRRCVYCHSVYKPIPHEIQGLCPECQRNVPQRTGGYCPSCGAIYATNTMPNVPCLQCLQDPPPWQRLLFYGVYDDVLRKIVHEAKFNLDSPALGLAGEFLCIAARPLQYEHIDAIIPVPLHISRLRERGGNQCVEMARPLSRFLGVPIRHDILHRVRKTPHQIGLTAKERRRNLDNAFEATSDCRGMHVILIDDVMTTGTTTRRCTEALQAAGVASVTVLVVARVRGH